MTEERWLAVKGYEDSYEVSDAGTVRSLTRFVPSGYGSVRKTQGRLLKPKVDRYGYLTLSLSHNQKEKHSTVHRLVASAFLPNPESKDQVNHKDGNKQNNHVSNLEWSTGKENMQHAHRTGLKNNNHTMGERCNFSKLTISDVTYIRRNYNKKSCNQARLAQQFGVSISTISMILNNKTWNHLNHQNNAE